MHPHQVAAAGAIGSAGITVANAIDGAGLTTVAANALLTLLTTLVSAWLKSRANKAQKGGEK